MGSAAELREKKKRNGYFLHTCQSNIGEKKFLNKKHSLQGRPESTEMNRRLLKNVPTVQGKKSIQTLH